jgi:hypothetical protein
LNKKFKPLIGSPTLRERCLYCGAIATVREHYRPWAISQNPYWVPSCRQCNSYLGTKLHRTIADRAGYLLKRYDLDYGDTENVDFTKVKDGTTGNLLKYLTQEESCRLEINRRIYHLDFWTLAGRTIDLETIHLDALAQDRLVEILDAIRGYRSLKND